MRLMTDIIKKLANGEILPPKNRDIIIFQEINSNCRECYIAPEWLSIYEVYEDGTIPIFDKNWKS